MEPSKDLRLMTRQENNITSEQARNNHSHCAYEKEKFEVRSVLNKLDATLNMLNDHLVASATGRSQVPLEVHQEILDGQVKMFNTAIKSHRNVSQVLIGILTIIIFWFTGLELFFPEKMEILRRGKIEANSVVAEELR